MLFNVPQFIEIEDKMVGPLTAKQIGWLGIGGILLLIFWNLLDTSAFIIAAIVIVGLFGALAFYRPYNQSLIGFIISSFRFVFRPKIYIWEINRDDLKLTMKHGANLKQKKVIERKTLNSAKIIEISKILDNNHGNTTF